MAVALIGTPAVGQGDFVTSITFGMTIAAGSNRCLAVAIAGAIPDSVTYDGSALTQARADSTTSIYYMVAPPVGTANVVVSGAQVSWEAVACNLTGVDQTTPLADDNGHAGSFGVNVSDAITIPTDGLGLDVLNLNAFIPTTADGAQVAIVSNDSPGGSVNISVSYTLSGSAMGWTHDEAGNYAHSVASFAPSGGGGGVKSGLNFFYRKTNGNL